MKRLIMTIALLTSSASFAANINGVFVCSDDSTLKVRQVDLGRYQANLRFADGGTSTLDEFIFRGESLRGQMLRDDDDALMGHVIIVSGGAKLLLTFLDGDSLDCKKQ